MTALYGVFGHPIGHSLSPQMQNAAFRDLGIDAYYYAFDVLPNNLEKAVNGIRALGIKGFNVTIPHKVAIMDFLDEIVDDAAELGAVNTVKNKNGKLIGYNTDGKGYTQGLLSQIKQFSGQNVLLIGAGGAARGILLALLKENIQSVTIINRTVEKAISLIEKCDTPIPLLVKTITEVENSLQDYDIIINTTPIGMYPNMEEVPLNLKTLKPGTIVSDIIYNPIETKLLTAAKEYGGIIQNGLPMFVNQGALAFEIWTGKRPNYEVMKGSVIKQLEE